MTMLDATTVIPQRELRNNVSDVLRRVKEGESFTVTTNDEPIARLIPAVKKYPTVSRPAKKRNRWQDFPSVQRTTPSEVILDELREDRV